MKIQITVDFDEGDRMRIARTSDVTDVGRLASDRECREWLDGVIEGGFDDLACDDPDDDEAER